MTGYGFTGPWTARGTVFSAKSASASTVLASRYRYGYRYGWMSVVLILLKVPDSLPPA